MEEIEDERIKQLQPWFRLLAAQYHKMEDTTSSKAGDMK